LTQDRHFDTNTTMSAAIQTCGLGVTFPSRTGTIRALHNLDLTIEPGTVFGFLGPNGAGKTTTIHVLLGFLSATAGTASLFGKPVTESIARERIGYLTENPDTYGFLTGRELLTMTGRLFRMPSQEIRRRSDRLLEETGLAMAADRRIASYSRGMRQRICMAQALINDPDLLILDEPTGGLDPLGRMEIRRLIAARRAAGKTVFFSSHELSEVELVCDRVAILVGGELAAEGRVEDLVRPGESLERYFIELTTHGTPGKEQS
jgi:ABC-2 type transport system ATP-binding protein